MRSAGDVRTEAIPAFFLYGEAPRAVERLLHIEDLDERTRPANWNIRPHSHGNLNHLFHIRQGGGVLKADSGVIHFVAPCILLIPSKVVHGFEYERDAQGTVVTISDSYREEMMRRDAALERLFQAPLLLNQMGEAVVGGLLARLSRELTWTAPGHAAALEAVLVTLLIECLRAAHLAEAEPAAGHGAQAGLVARFRALVEAGYRTETRVEAYAEQLAVSPKRLRAACLKVAGATPLRIVQERLLLEAKRLMLYSNMTIAEAGYYLGFSDPAYFTRVFTKGVGVSPREFRASAPLVS